MNKRMLQVLFALSLFTVSSFAAKERVIRFQNNVRVGYDDNIYATSDKTGSAFVSDIINFSLKANFSSRTDFLLYWQPEFQYRLDGDPKTVMYQDLYGRLNHAISSKAFLTISDRFRYQQKEGQTGAGLNPLSQNFIENDLKGSIDYNINTKSYMKLGAGYAFRVWEDENYGEGTRNNNYDQIDANGSYNRTIKPNRTEGSLAVQFRDLAYTGSRGGFTSTTFMGGLDQNFNPDVIGFGRLGVSLNQVDGGATSSDSASPYFQTGLEVNPNSRTSFNGSLGYSLARSENSVYNAQDRFSLGLGARQDLTAKISLATSLTYIFSYYDAKYSNGTVVGLQDAKDNYFTLTLRASYQINRNNFIEMGYLYANRASDFTDWNRNRIDMAWRLRL